MDIKIFANGQFARFRFYNLENHSLRADLGTGTELAIGCFGLKGQSANKSRHDRTQSSPYL